MEFVGRLVKVATVSEMELEGRIENVDAELQDLTLSNVSVYRNGKSKLVPKLVLNSKDIAELNILDEPSSLTNTDTMNLSDPNGRSFHPSTSTSSSSPYSYPSSFNSTMHTTTRNLASNGIPPSSSSSSSSSPSSTPPPPPSHPSSSSSSFHGSVTHTNTTSMTSYPLVTGKKKKVASGPQTQTQNQLQPQPQPQSQTQAQDQNHERKEALQQSQQEQTPKFMDPAIISYSMNHSPSSSSSPHPRSQPSRTARSTYDSSSSSSSRSHTKSSRPMSSQQHPYPHHPSTPSSSGWAQMNVNHYHTDFDIQGNLQKFDKSGLFAEFNKNPSMQVQPRSANASPITHHPTSSSYSNVPRTHSSSSSSSSSLLSSISMPPTTNATTTSTATMTSLLRRKKTPFSSSSEFQPLTFWAPHQALKVPTATALQMVEAERVALEEFGLTSEITAVQVGRSIATLIFQLLESHPFFQPSSSSSSPSVTSSTSPSSLSSFPSSPRVIFFIGNQRTGAYTLASALTLLHRGVDVTLILATQQPIPLLQTYLNLILQCKTAHVYHDVTHLSFAHYDVLVESLLSTSTFIDLAMEEDRELVCESLEFIRELKVPILSVDVPSGLDATTGIVPFPDYIVVPNWTVCLGIPKAGLVNPSATGQVYLADIGFPNDLWKRSGVHLWPSMSPFGTQFIVPLEYHA